MTASTREATAEKGMMIIKTTNRDQRLVDMTEISLTASGATEMKLIAVEKVIATREMSVTAGHGHREATRHRERRHRDDR
jgi:hypothetical protein